MAFSECKMIWVEKSARFNKESNRKIAVLSELINKNLADLK